jgi:hypothetical protein
MEEREEVMKRRALVISSALSVAIWFVSCGSPAGTGAVAGAGAGAVVGGPIGAAAGAAGGAIVGAVVGKREAREYPRPPRGDYPVAQPATQPGYVISPYTGRLYDVRAVPSGALVRDVDADQLFRRP